MGSTEVEGFLTHLATERHVAPSTHKQALPGPPLPIYAGIGHRAALDAADWSAEKSGSNSGCAVAGGSRAPARAGGSDVRGYGRIALRCRPALDGSLRLRVKDLDFDRKILIVRAGKGRKDRAVMLPEPLNIPLRRQLEHSRPLWAEDRARRVPGVAMPDALAESIRAPLRAGPGTGYSRRLPCLLIRALAFVADIISMSKPSVARLRADPCGIGVRQSLPSSGTLHSLLLTALPFRCRSNHAICLLSASTRSA